MSNLRRLFLSQSDISEAQLLPTSGYGNMIVRKLYLPIPKTIPSTDYQVKMTSISIRPCNNTGSEVLSTNTYTYKMTDTINVGWSEYNDSMVNVGFFGNDGEIECYIFDAYRGLNLVKSGSDISTIYPYLGINVFGNSNYTSPSLIIVAATNSYFDYSSYYLTKFGKDQLFVEVDFSWINITKIGNNSIKLDHIKLLSYQNNQFSAGPVYYLPAET